MPLPALPDEPFTRSELTELRITPAELRAAVERGQVRRLLRGVYVAARVPESADLRVRALRRVVSVGHIACDRTAAWLHGVDVHSGGRSAYLTPIEVCALRGQVPTERRNVHARTRDLRRDDIDEVGGVLVTTPLRTALDLGCILRRRDALAAIDQLRRRFGISEADLRRSLVRYARRRGVVQLRQLVPLSDPRAESPRESWTRLAIIDAGLPAPVSQYMVETWEGSAFRLDHGYPHERVAVEYDGAEFHHTLEQQTYDTRRRLWLEANGWTVLVVRSGDFSGVRLEFWLDQLREALRPT